MKRKRTELLRVSHSAQQHPNTQSCSTKQLISHPLWRTETYSGGVSRLVWSRRAPCRPDPHTSTAPCWSHTELAQRGLKANTAGRPAAGRETDLRTQILTLLFLLLTSSFCVFVCVTVCSFVPLTASLSGGPWISYSSSCVFIYLDWNFYKVSTLIKIKIKKEKKAG